MVRRPTSELAAARREPDATSAASIAGMRRTDPTRRPAMGAPLLVVLVAAVACSPAVTVPPTSPPGRPSATPPASARSSSTASAQGTAGSSASGPAPSGSAVASTTFDPTGLKLKVDVVVDGLAAPLDVTNAADGSGRLFVAEQGGQIRIVKAGALVGRPFLDIGGRISSGGERGLLGLAFHPGYPADPRFFVNYTDRDGNTVISSFRVSASDPDMADPDSESIILRVNQPFPNHNGGSVVFGPDGMLYLGLGDGGSGGDPQGNGQRLDTLLAKILRIDVDGDSEAPYRVPADNPFVSVAGARPEIWLTGLRNPWRIRFDRATGDLWIGDVGQALWEEIDVARTGVSGLNYGWNTMEGFHCFNPSRGCNQTGLTLPVAEYGHDLGCAVIGGVVVRDPRQPRLDGGYLFGDDCSDNLWVMSPVGDGRREPLIAAKIGRSTSSIGEGEDGTVYATSLGGELLRISTAGS